MSVIAVSSEETPQGVLCVRRHVLTSERKTGASLARLDFAETVTRTASTKVSRLLPQHSLFIPLIMSIPETHKVVRLHPADHTIHVETLPAPKYVLHSCLASRLG